MSSLRELARMHGIQTDYQDVLGQRQVASTESLLGALQCLGVPIQRPREAAGLRSDCRTAAVARWCEPVYVHWEGRLPIVQLGPGTPRTSTVDCHLRQEDGKQLSFASQLERSAGGGPRFRLPHVPPPGYHQLQITAGPAHAESRLFVAPPRAFSRSSPQADRDWGLFLPVYALQRELSWGAGDFSDLEAFIQWTCDQGGRLVATLPLLASFFDWESDPSPYTPASRLFWNEFYLAVEELPEFRQSPVAQQLFASHEFQRELQALRASDTVQYGRMMQLKRRVLELLSEGFFQHRTSRRSAFERFVGCNPDAESYAGFRAACEQLGRPWINWTEPARAGQLEDHHFDSSHRQYHLFVQWLVDEQLGQLAERSAERGAAWYLDLPLGVHPDSYDVWRYRDSFALSASGGAPPDAFFTKGQCWGFPPLHPVRIREKGHEYFTRVIRHHLQYAGMLRIDHVMGLHRLYWVPQGMEASQGVYVQYPHDELYAILAIESHRARARVIGENLGTVPKAVNAAMDRRHLGQLYVAQYEARPEAEPCLPKPQANSVASLNTHDMPTFASFWNARDIDDRVDLGLMSPAEAERERESRAALRTSLAAMLRREGLLEKDSAEEAEVLRALTCWLGRSPCEVTLVNLEDAWLEQQPQNTPGTVMERVNWRRKAKYRLEAIRELRSVLDLLHSLDSARRRPDPTHPTL